ncbi:regulator of Vps4 activity in the MVB pathway-domain-containing protein [Lipomyces mesembrius]
MQKKDRASSVSQRRELTQLLDNAREASARIRVENVIATDIAVEVMEMVELYCEPLLARASVLDQIASGDGTRPKTQSRGSRLRQRVPAVAAAADWGWDSLDSGGRRPRRRRRQSRSRPKKPAEAGRRRGRRR